MTGATKVIARLFASAIVISGLIVPAYSQGFSKGKGFSGPPVETRPKTDDKAYKAALDRIPTPKEKYDPWGNARSSESGSGKRPN
jgi:hypothetical protein